MAQVGVLFAPYFIPSSVAAAGALVGKKARPLHTSRAACPREASGSGAGRRASKWGSAGKGYEGGLKLDFKRAKQIRAQLGIDEGHADNREEESVDGRGDEGGC